MEDSKKSGMEKVYHYSRMTNISKLKSLSDHDNKELFPISGSSFKKVCSSSYSENEEEETINIDDPESSNSDML